MAGNQMGLGRMFQQIGTSMGQWGEQKRQAKQQAMARALQTRQLELQEQAGERAQAEADAAAEQRKFDNTFQVANVLAPGTPLTPEASISFKDVGLGSLIKPSAPANFNVPNVMTGVSGPSTQVQMPDRWLGTQPPALRQADMTNSRLQAQQDQMMAYRLADLQRKIEDAAARNDMGLMRALAAQANAVAAQMNAQTNRQGQQDRGFDMGVDNTANWNKQAMDYAKALLSDNMILQHNPTAYQAEFDRVVQDWKDKNPQPTPPRESGIRW